ncbi:MAG TPA: alanine racemase [Caulobacter sp.]|nr:alanine racemase [Caulobacter sp.]
MTVRIDRRRMMLAGGGAVALGAAATLALRPGDHGGVHSPYFLGLQSALGTAGLARPTLVIDRRRLDANITAVKTFLPARQGLRVVVKSLPSLGLLDAVARGVGTSRFMVFNGPMLATMAAARPDGDYLMGKPLAAPEAKAFYDAGPGKAAGLDPARQLQWLIDTPARLDQYAAVARAAGTTMRVSLEIDVGLHRGGFNDPAGFAVALHRIAGDPVLSLGGLMGYDPHLSHVKAGGGRDKALARSRVLYQGFLDQVREAQGAGFNPAALTLNTAGSPTYRLHHDSPYANDISVGSAFVKPLDFDVDTLAAHVPAAYIATPVLKALPRTDLPTAESLTPLFRLWDRNTARAFFIHGGHWLAAPVSPPGLQYSSLFGRSSNQELLTGSEKVSLSPDDTVFLRPTQSEAVLLQFGDLAVWDGKAISAMWPVFPVSA